jgi:amino-acid N-acetyltransferase
MTALRSFDRWRLRPMSSAQVSARRSLEQAEGYAYAHGVRSLYLLTTSAQRFFKGRGYRPTSREDCPASNRSTSQFASLCPASSALLVKTWL